MKSSIAAAQPALAIRRYLVERTFPAGALDGVDATAKKNVNDNNATVPINAACPGLE